jgi:hypothetical protein
MKKSEIKVLPKHFDKYIQLVDDQELLIALRNSLHFAALIDLDLLHQKADYSYAPGKWSPKDILQHLIDTERILTYRALRFARNDNTELPGFEEADYAKNTNASRRTINDLLGELAIVRNATIMLFQNFDNTMLQREGVCFKLKINVLSLGFTVIGHQLHHFNVIQTRYFN